MIKQFSKHLGVLLLAGFISLAPVVPVMATECTLPNYTENIKPELAAKYKYTEDGEFSKALGIPTYEWTPVDMPIKAVVLAVHGLTLHGRLFRVLARSMAAHGIAFVALDMRGFGRCKFDPEHQFSTKDDDRTKVDHEKSYEDIVKLAKLIKQRYPDQRLIAMGESLGCTFCVKLAAEHPDLVQAVALSAPAVRVNKSMYAGKGQILQGVKALFKPSHQLNMRGFFAELCSNKEEIQKELMDDPVVLKELKLRALASTDKFVAKTAKYGKQTSATLPVLILQGSVDGCVSPKRVTDLMNSMKSDDQTLAWRGNFGHLQLETCHMRVATLDAIAEWLFAHGADAKVKLLGFQQSIADAGGIVTK